MSTANTYQTTTIQATEDLNSHQFQAVALNDGKVANNGGEASGVLLGKPKSGEHAEVGWLGEMKFRAGEAVTADGPITVATSGYFTEAASGDYIVGRAKAAVTSGSIGTGLFNFAQPVYAFSSSFAW